MNANYSYFKDNLSELVKKYDNSFVVIKDCCVIGSYDDFETAYVETTKTESLGTFIIQHCTPNALEPTAFFAWNNVSFDSVKL